MPLPGAHYRPSAEQAHYVRARDRRCQAPAAAAPASQCDIDHTRPWHIGGTTHECNLAVLRRRHHRAKDGGWRLTREEFGLIWISPRGRAYAVPLARELDTGQRRLLQHLITEGERRRTTEGKRRTAMRH